MTISVSVIVPCRNEFHYIAEFLQCLQSQDLTGLTLEVLIADGQSNDGTRTILENSRAKNFQIIILDNPLGIVSTGLNAAIEVAKGEYIIRMDVHTFYEKDYIRSCIEVIQRTNATCVGGAWIARGVTPTEKAIAHAFQSPIGSGGALSRLTTYSGAVDTVYLGCWHKSSLVSLGGFDEKMVRNQDDELSLRILKSGGTIWQDQSINSYYKTRSTLKQLFQQFFQYGYWKLAVMKKHKQPASARHLIPFIFVILVILSWLVAPFSILSLYVASFLTLFYALTIILIVFSKKIPKNQMCNRFVIVEAIVLMHFGYGLGFAFALFNTMLQRPINNNAATKLSR